MARKTIHLCDVCGDDMTDEKPKNRVSLNRWVHDNPGGADEVKLELCNSCSANVFTYLQLNIEERDPNIRRFEHKDCGYQAAYQTACKNSYETCEHRKKKCAGCGEPAIKECNYSGQFVCGRPTCGKEECNCWH